MKPILVAINALVAALFISLLSPAAARSEPYPTRAVTIIVPFPPGGAIDPVARIIQDDLGRLLGQSIVVENRPGSAGNIGATAVMRAPPDGYTLLLVANATLTMNPFLYKSIAFDPLTAFTPIAALAEQQLCVAVNASLPIHNMRDFVNYARKQPGELSVGTSGLGSPHHILAMRLERLAGLKLTLVPYAGGAPAVANLLGGHIGASFSTLPSVSPHIATGKVRIIAFAESKRFPGMPDVQTIAETVPGIPGFEGATAWTALLGPAGLPRDVVDKISAATGTALEAPHVKAQLAKLGFTPSWSTPGQLKQRMDHEHAAWGRIIREVGVQPQ